MRHYRSLSIMIASALLLIGCTNTNKPALQTASNFINRQSVIATTKEAYPAKSPQGITVFAHDQTPHTAYRVIGLAKVSQYNLIGVKRPEATLHDMMKSLAASIGGDGLIDVSTDHEGIQAKVIQFQRIMI